MEVFLYNSTVCRLCGEENDNGTLLYTSEENIQTLSEVINAFLPIKVTDDGQLPRTICPGCTIQLEATVEFLNLIINGQKVIRELYQREKEYKKTIFSQPLEETVIPENIINEVDTSTEIYQVDHPITLQVAGLERPRRKRGRPPKKPKSQEELAQEVATREQQEKSKRKTENDELTGKRRRKTPTRFMGVVQGKELEKIFKEEGMSDGETSDTQDKEAEVETAPRPTVLKQAEVIGHKENSGELVVVVKGKGRGRPKGRMRPTHEECNICGMKFSCVGRYMSHVAQHGPVSYQCAHCKETFTTRLLFNIHQREQSHAGQNIISGAQAAPLLRNIMEKNEPFPEQAPDSNNCEIEMNNSVAVNSRPAFNQQPLERVDVNETSGIQDIQEISTPGTEPRSDMITVEDKTKVVSEPVVEDNPGIEQVEKSNEDVTKAVVPKGKLKCNYCDKLFSSKQSKSLHTKATHYGERPYVCADCGACFGYPHSLVLHKLKHRRARNNAQGYACDLCGKVLNHPSSVVYHKEAEHAGQRYVCNKCNKSFKHKQLLARHQLVHTQIRPYSCKVCNASFKTKASLLNHQFLHTGVKKYTCEICNDKFAHKTSHTLHMRWHTGVKPYSCKICGKCFSQKGNLSEHERIHTGEKPYQCAHCPRRFTTSSQHRLHMRRHFADRPFACDTCPKRFASRGARAAHERREAGCREHKCTECSRGFAERWALVKHMRRHTGERPFRCPHCPRTFADCSNLNKHKKQVHKQISLLASENHALEESTWSATTFTIDTGLELEEPDVGSDHQDLEHVTVIEAEAEEPDERVIYVACDVDDEGGTTDYRILESDQEESQTVSEVIETTERKHMQSVIVDGRNQIPVTDEQGNPLHFTMQDGTRLAITSSDGKTLQVITEDGQTIPVEINGYAEEEEVVHNPNKIVHQLDLNKSVDANVAAPVMHYFAIV